MFLGARQFVGTLPLPPAGGEGAAVPGDGHAPGGSLHRGLPGVGECAEAAVRSATQQGHVQSAAAARTQMSHLTYTRCTPFAL